MGEGAAPAGEARNLAPGRRRGSARRHYGLLRSWLTVRAGYPEESAARRRKENAAMARRQARRSRKGSHTEKEGCAHRRAIPLIFG